MGVASTSALLTLIFVGSVVFVYSIISIVKEFKE